MILLFNKIFHNAEVSDKIGVESGGNHLADESELHQESYKVMKLVMNVRFKTNRSCFEKNFKVCNLRGMDAVLGDILNKVGIDLIITIRLFEERFVSILRSRDLETNTKEESPPY